MPYRIRLSDEARRDLLELPGNVRQRVRRSIAALEGAPRPRGAKELRERAGVYRQRLERWRIIYHVVDDDLLVIVLAVRRKTGPRTYDDYDDVE